MFKKIVVICSITAYSYTFCCHLGRTESPIFIRTNPSPDNLAEALPGRSTVFTGPMCSKKSDQLMAAIGLASHAKLKFSVFKPKRNDDRQNNVLVSRTRPDTTIEAISVTNPSEIEEHVNRSPVSHIFIDDAHLFNQGIVKVVETLMDNGIELYIAGRNTACDGTPYKCMGDLLAIGTHPITCWAFCQKCKAKAFMTKMLSSEGLSEHHKKALNVLLSRIKKLAVTDDDTNCVPCCRRCHDLPVSVFVDSDPDILLKYPKHGRLTIYCGPMCSNKTYHLFGHIDDFKQRELEFLVFKSTIDTRSKGLVSRAQPNAEIEAISVTDPTEILKKIAEHKVTKVVIDEVQFFPLSILEVVIKILAQGIDIYMAGLDTQFNREPFGCIAPLLAIAQFICKNPAICENLKCLCYEATLTQRLVDGQPAHKHDVAVEIEGEKHNTVYEPRCRKKGCHILPE